MKVAYLIIAHKNIEQIKNLILELENGGGDVFIHVDSSMSSSEYLDLYGQCKSDRCYFVEKRMHGKLDDRSLIDITMLCINEALTCSHRNQIHYDYFVLLSGQDYPIKPMKWIEEQLAKSYPMPYIESYSISEKGEKAAVVKYNRNRWLLCYRDWVLNNFHGIPGKFFQGIGMLLRNGLKLCGQTPAQKLFKQGITVYMGSAWWVLPDQLIEPVFNAYKEKDTLTETLIAESYTPEETFFQTICRIKSYEKFFAFNGGKEGLRNCKTYTDFGRQSKREPVCHPYILTVNDFERLEKTHCWFARKFDDTVDSEIIKKIKRELL